jgi:aminoglycoside 2''-phosphotransferase
MPTSSPDTIDAALRARLALVLPSTPHTLRAIEDGSVNRIIVADERYVARIPRAPEGHADAAREVALLTRADGKLGIRVPRVLKVEGDVVLLEYLAGEALGWSVLRDLPPALGASLLDQLVGALATLHALPSEGLPRAAQVADAAWVKDIDTRVTQHVLPLLPMGARRDAERALAAAASAVDANEKLCATHADLHPEHVLWDPAAGVLTGLIDWGWSGIGDPALDLAQLAWNYGQRALAAIRRVHPRAAELLPRAIALAALFELDWAARGVAAREPTPLLWHLGGAKAWGDEA